MSNNSRRLILWRHGQTEWNIARRVQGQTDIPLDDQGRAQAVEAAARLAALKPDIIVSSDLSRAADTAKALSNFTGIEVKLDERLREMNFGEREGLTFKETIARWPNRNFWESTPENRIPGAETYEETADRFVSAVRDLLDVLQRGQTAVVVGHGAVLRVGAAKFLNFPSESWWTIGGLNNCAWSVLTETNFGPSSVWRITEWNAGQLPEPVLSDEE